MTFPYKKVLVIGATSGIGLALAERLVQNGSYVVAVGRRKENLDEFVKKHPSQSSAVPFDVTKTAEIPRFVQNLTKSHPDIDSIFLNSGIQRRTDFSEPASVDMATIELEFNTNYLAHLALTKEFLPFLTSKESETSLVYTSSGLALVPIMRCPNYCATKAAMHQFILVLREQLRQTKVKVIEVFPPAVQTELHDEKHQPDLKGGRSMGMPLDQFTNETWDGLTKGKDQITVGFSRDAFVNFEEKRQEQFQKMIAQMK